LLHLIDAENRHLPRYAQMLEDSYRVRHDIYVNGRGWKALERPDGREIDQFDNLDATYLLWADDDEVVAGARFVPTHLPHLMSDIFPHIVTLGEIPCTPKVWEVTRLFTARSGKSKANRRNCTGEVLCGMFEMGLHFDLESISVVCDTFFLPRFLESGVQIKPLGLPTDYAEGSCIACIIPVSPAQLAAARGGKRGRVLFDVGVPEHVHETAYAPRRVYAAH
jgi:acyl-homoserine lactone synthase